MLRIRFAICSLTVFAMATSLTAGEPAWDAKAAAGYLDSRASWWMAWPSAARDHETFCVSCHTAVPYALGRSALHKKMGETGPTETEQKLIANVTKRVKMWKEAAPFYPDKATDALKTAESRGTEGILNALILTHSATAPADVNLALDNMWEQQLTDGEAKGAFPWLQFHNSPWEGDSQFYGAALAAVAVSKAPSDYRAQATTRDHMKALAAYLQKESSKQILADRIVVLWASANWPELLSSDDKRALTTEVLSKQHDDGGFSLSSLVGEWKRRDKTPLETKSDGYATGLVTYVLQQTGLGRENPKVRAALDWLSQNQEKSDGRWLAYSLNKQRDLSTDVGKFMSDAATAYAVMALNAKE